MDDYEKYYYIREPQAKNRESGDISAQLALREKLQCKSFEWYYYTLLLYLKLKVIHFRYMKNVAYDVFKSYPLLPDNDVWGEAKNLATGKF